jgi:hypothetical protein
LSGLLEEVSAQAAGDGLGLKGATSVTDGSEDGTGTGLKFREPSISAAAQPAELGWEEQPSALAVGELDADGNMKEMGSLQVGMLLDVWQQKRPLYCCCCCTHVVLPS